MVIVIVLHSETSWWEMSRSETRETPSTQGLFNHGPRKAIARPTSHPTINQRCCYQMVGTLRWVKIADVGIYVLSTVCLSCRRLHIHVALYLCGICVCELLPGLSSSFVYQKSKPIDPISGRWIKIALRTRHDITPSESSLSDLKLSTGVTSV